MDAAREIGGEQARWEPGGGKVEMQRWGPS